MDSDLRTKLAGEVHSARASELLPHHRRGGLLVLDAGTDLLDVAQAVAADDAETVAELVAGGQLYRPSLAQLATWCVDSAMRFQVVILQPYVLAQPILAPGPAFN